MANDPTDPRETQTLPTLPGPGYTPLPGDGQYRYTPDTTEQPSYPSGPNNDPAPGTEGSGR